METIAGHFCATIFVKKGSSRRLSNGRRHLTAHNFITKYSAKKWVESQISREDVSRFELGATVAMQGNPKQQPNGMGTT